MKTKAIRKTIMIVSIISIIGFGGYAFANMRYSSHMGGYGYHMMNGFNGQYRDHMGENGRYGRHMDNGNHMYNYDHRGSGMYNSGHMYNNNFDYNRMAEDMNRFHNGYERNNSDSTKNRVR